MMDQKIYTALAKRETAESVLSELLEPLGAEVVMLYYLGKEEADVSLRSATQPLLKEMKQKLFQEIQSHTVGSSRTPDPHHVNLAIPEILLSRVRAEAKPFEIKVHMISYGNEMLGGLAIAFHAPGKEIAAKELEQLLAALGFAQKIEAAQRADEESRDRLERFTLVGQVLAEGLSLERTLTRLLEITLNLVESHVGAFYLKPEAGESAPQFMGWGMAPEWIQHLKLKTGRNFLEASLLEEKPSYFKNLDLLDPASCPRFLNSMVVVPMIFEGGVLGCLFVVNPPMHFFSSESEKRTLIAMASLAGSAICSVRHLKAELYAERLRDEVRLAAYVQSTLLPKELPLNPGLEVAGMIRSASELGGDFYDVFELGDGKWGVMVADVSGKGASAAILTATARAYLRAFSVGESSPSRVFQKMNQALARDFKDGRFLTAVYLIFDLPKRQVQMAGAGHHPVFFLKANGTFDCIPCDDYPLGIFDEGSFSDTVLDIEPGTTLFVYTDGLIEAAAPDGRFFGSEKMHSVVPSLANLAAQQVLDRLLLEVEAWTGKATFRDDLTILVARIK